MGIVASSSIFHEQSTAWVDARSVGIVELSSIFHEQSTAWVGARGVGIVVLSSIIHEQSTAGVGARVWELLNFPVFFMNRVLLGLMLGCGNY